MIFHILTPRKASDHHSIMLVDNPPDLLVVVPGLTPLTVQMPVKMVASSPHPNSQSESNYNISDDDGKDDCSPYDASRQDILNAYSFVVLDLEEMPIITLDKLLYYRYGFSLNEVPYTGIP